jgi:peptidyl-prolyl cis-trans isomerase B (cyclophilin B)
MRSRTIRWFAGCLSIAAAGLVFLAGCNKGDDGKKPTPRPEVQVVQKTDNQGKPIQAQTVARANNSLSVSFQQAAILDPAPEGELQPPNFTHTGKSTIKIFESIINDLWDKTGFVTSEGKRIRYQAVMKTDLGDIHIDLRGDVAPNHVRNFVCLAKAGYYDGMAFYYTLNRKTEDSHVAYIESGCPKGTGEDGFGNIGYWLKPEFSDKLTHDEGVIGACLRRTPETAACRFYITAASMPQMDGEFTAFGKVSQGLDIVRTINNRAVQENDRPVQPVTIKSVTILTVME